MGRDLQSGHSSPNSPIAACICLMHRRKWCRAALNYLGLNPDSRERGDLDKAGRVAEFDPAAYPEVPFLRIYQCPCKRRYLPGSRLCRAMCSRRAIARGRGRTGRHRRLRDTQPRALKCGLIRWPFRWTAKHVDEAHEFLNYIMRPDVIAKASQLRFFTQMATKLRKSCSTPKCPETLLSIRMPKPPPNSTPHCPMTRKHREL